MKHSIFLSFALLFSSFVGAQDATVKITPNPAEQQISRMIYGQFAEHLGSCIYGGLWVGKDSEIPNTDGYRNDVLNALKELKVPVLRWPGGCFADDYHWMDGIGPKAERPSLRNNTWGGTIEDNSFGTHEFLNLCELLGCEPYVCGNVGSGTVKEMAQWVEYMTNNDDSPMARLRRQNGRDKAWKVKYFGIGNEAWGCGGNMTPEYYSNEYRKFNTYLRDYPGNRLFRIASGANSTNYNWTKVLMKNIGTRMNGISVHYYTVKDWHHKGKATIFTDDEYYLTLDKCLMIDDALKEHCRIMDEADPKKRVALMVDEWGTWWDEEPGTIPGHLYQQNSLRDAIVASLMLNVFHKYTDRVKMANIAQLVNVLQAMILTDTKGKGHMVLTPTYHVFEMYKPFQDAKWHPAEVSCGTVTTTEGKQVPMVSATAATATDGRLVVALTNTSLDKAQRVNLDLTGFNTGKAEARILTAADAKAYNDFEHTDNVKPAAFNSFKIKKGTATVDLPSKSIVVMTIEAK